MKLVRLREREKSGVQNSEKSPEGIFHFKYIPRTGEPGQCDAQYPTFSLNMAAGVNAVEKVLIADTSKCLCI
jgi:hypothetical protein